MRVNLLPTKTAKLIWRGVATRCRLFWQPCRSLSLSISQSDFHSLLGYGKLSVGFDRPSGINTKGHGCFLTCYRYLYVMMWYLLYLSGRAEKVEEADTAREGLPRSQSTRLLAAHLHQELMQAWQSGWRRSKSSRSECSFTRRARI